MNRRAPLPIVALALALAGCAAAPQPVVREYQGIFYIDAPGIDCPGAPRAAGCISLLPIVFRTQNDPAVEDHEREHLLGMRHTAWKQYGATECATATIGGATHWKPGDLMCRMPSGRFEIGNK